MNEKRKLQHEFYEFCKSDEFYDGIDKEIQDLIYKRRVERSKINNNGLGFKSTPLDKINADIVFEEFYKVVKKKSELPRSQRELVYIIGMKVLQKLRP